MPKVKVTKDDGTCVDIEYQRNEKGVWMITSRKETKMDEMKIIIDGKEYTEERFNKDIIRMFDEYRWKDSKYMGSNCCTSVSCNNCPLHSLCNETNHNSYYKIIKTVYDWAKEHPLQTNADKLIEIFGEDALHHINLIDSKEYWLKKEYKDPKGGKENG